MLLHMHYNEKRLTYKVWTLISSVSFALYEYFMH